MGKELFKNIPSKVGDLVKDVRNGVSVCLIFSVLLFRGTIKFVSYSTLWSRVILLAISSLIVIRLKEVAIEKWRKGNGSKWSYNSDAESKAVHYTA